MDTLKELIAPGLVVLIPVMNLIGMALKQSERIKDQYIPFYLGIISVLLCSLEIFSTLATFNLHTILLAIFSSITQGVLVAGTSVYFHQMYRQIQKNK